MSREYPMFGLRMPPELRQSIEREAKINGRSINAEVVDRLKRSLLDQAAIAQRGYGAMEEKRADEYANVVTDVERQLLMVFRRMPVEKQLALLSLFK